MAYDFPTSPAFGTIVTLPDGTFRVWDGVKWKAAPSVAGTPTPTPITNDYDVTASGTDQATAHPVSANYVRVVAGDYDSGIRVEPQPPLHTRLVNTAGVQIQVWPPPGCFFSDLPTDTSFPMQDTQSGFFVRKPGSNEITVSA